MQKKQEVNKKKKSQRTYGSFIHIVKCWKDDFILTSHISNIYDRSNDNEKNEIEVYRLPIWRDVTEIQRLAYFLYFMVETREFTSIKPFTLDFSKEFRNKYKNLSYKELKAVIIKRMYGNLDYKLQSISKPMMSFILENKVKSKRKDVNDKETHIHGIREVFNDENLNSKVILSLKTSVCNGNKEYKRPEYRNMLHTRDGYSNYRYGATGWMWYMNKGASSNNGLYISTSLLEKIRNDYNQLYTKYVEYIKEFKCLGVKVKFINAK